MHIMYMSTSKLIGPMCPNLKLTELILLNVRNIVEWHETFRTTEF